MNKKGFTLVELLAVIAILAILVIIALPNVMGMFNTAKQNSFNTEVKEIYKTAQQKWMLDNMSQANAEKTYTRDSMTKELSGRADIKFIIHFNKAGKVTSYRASDGTYWYASNSTDLQVEDIKDSGKWADSTKPKCKASQSDSDYSSCADHTAFMNAYAVTPE